MPTLVAKPWPSGPVVASTPEVMRYSGWPGQRLPAWRKCSMSSGVTVHLGAAADAGEVDQRIEQHGGMAGGQHEAVAVHPFRSGRVVAQITLPQRVGGWRGIHRRAGMTRLCLLDGIGREQADGVDGKLVDIGRVLHLGSWLPWEIKPGRLLQFPAACSRPYMAA